MVQRTSDQGLGTGAGDLTRHGPVARRIDFQISFLIDVLRILGFFLGGFGQLFDIFFKAVR